MGQVMQAFHVPLFLCASDAWRCSPPRPLCPRPRGTWDAGAELVPIERRGQRGLRVAGSTTDRPRAWHVSEQQWLMRPLARWYQNNVSHELAKYGLKLDDVRNEWHPDVQTALSRLSPEELSNRNKRLKRAMDLSLKHSELNKEAQAAVEPLVGYLPLERAREERLERMLHK